MNMNKIVCIIDDDWIVGMGNPITIKKEQE